MSEITDAFVSRVTTPSRFGLCPEPTEAQEALNVLIDYLIGEGECLSTMPLCTRQTNTIAVHYILREYSRKFRKEEKAKLKEARNDA